MNKRKKKTKFKPPTTSSGFRLNGNPTRNEAAAQMPLVGGGTWKLPIRYDEAKV